MVNEIGANKRILSWIIFIFILATGFLIPVFKNYSSFFVIFLIIAIGAAIYFYRIFNNAQITLGRLLLGAVFIFSGFVKGVDPVGTQYRIEDYFIAFGTDWAIPLALPLSVILNSVEFVIGAMLMLNINMKITAWLVMIVMAFFTLVTINDALNNPVPECGCFGDALSVSNWQTIYKNLVIDAFLLIVFLNRNRNPHLFSTKSEWILTVAIAILFIGFQVYNIRHLPVIDFRDWKVGRRMVIENPKPKQFYLLYRNKQTGEEKEYRAPDYPYNDSVWMSQWEFESQRVVDPNPKLTDLYIEDSEGNDVTASIIGNPDYQFMMISPDLDNADTSRMKDIRDLLDTSNEHGIGFALITGSLPGTAEKFVEQYNLNTDVYFADDITLKAMIRSNPGLILMKNGVVLNKWHYNDWPDFEEAIPTE